MPTSFFIDAVLRIAKVEGPVHVDAVKRRIAECFDEWLTKKLSARLDRYISAAIAQGDVVQRNDFRGLPRFNLQMFGS